MELDSVPAKENQLDRLRNLADKLDCLLETDVMLLGQVTASTVEAWRKRGSGPAHLMLGNRPLYPRKLFLKFLDEKTRVRAQVGVKELL